MEARAYVRAKRVVDCGLTLLSAPVTLPALAITALAVRLTLGSPVLFRQERPGLNGVPFEMLKFRTMHNIDESRGRVTNEERITKIGSALRRSSVDELPSLYNVLKGHMSLVGPRPLRTSYIPRYTEEQFSRHSVRPGLTGWAQVSGRNSLTWDDRLDIDVAYVDSMGPILDLQILFKTVSKVLLREGVAAEGQATMSEFFGPDRTTDLSIRRLELKDLPSRVKWLRDPEVREGITIAYWPDQEAMEAWFASAIKDDSRIDYTAVDRSSGLPKAMCGLTKISDESAELYIYVDPDSLGLGLGKQTMQMLVAKARQLEIGELKLETKIGNRRAKRMYESLGFTTSETNSISGKRKMRMKLGGHNQRRAHSAGGRASFASHQ